MQKVLAISGGVDSMVMLDLFCRQALDKSELVVAHFDHGIRENSGADAEFVQRKATEYGVEFCSERAQLGANTSEALAREKRYRFLYRVSARHGDAPIYTAHHLDDLAESILINLLRGTGWRGLAVLGSQRIVRPFLAFPSSGKPMLEPISQPMDKRAILRYAAKHHLTWREDPSNSWDDYLRNRLRQQLAQRPLSWAQKLQLHQLWRQQNTARSQIDQLVKQLIPKADEPWQRGWFTQLDDNIALELLRAGTLQSGISATRPQLRDFLQAIRTYPAGKQFNLPQDRLVKFGKKEFVL